MSEKQSQRRRNVVLGGTGCWSSLVKPRGAQIVAVKFQGKSRPSFTGRLLFRPAAAAAQDVVKCDRTATKKDQREGNRSHCERELESTFAHQSVVPMDFPDGYAQIDTDGEGGEASEESGQNHEAAKELRQGR